MRTTHIQERVTLTFDTTATVPCEALGHCANPYPDETFLHGLPMNGGRRLTLFVSNPTAAQFFIVIRRRATPMADWVIESTLTVAAGTATTTMYDIGGYAVRGTLLTNSLVNFEFDVSANIQSTDD